MTKNQFDDFGKKLDLINMQLGHFIIAKNLIVFNVFYFISENLQIYVQSVIEMENKSSLN